MVLKGTIEQLGKEAQSKTIKMSVEGLSNDAIAINLSKEYNQTITSNQVFSFLTRQKDKFIDVLKEDKKLQSKFANEYFDTVKQLKMINQEIVKLFFELRNNPDEMNKIINCPHCNKSFSVKLKNYLTLLKTSDTILKQIEHVDKVLGKLQKKQFNITYNYTDLSKKLAIAIPNMLHDMERKGLVKINKKRLKVYQGGRKMSYEDEEDEDEEDEE